MEEKIYTIPIHDAWNAEPISDCPLCRLEADATARWIDYFLSPAQMEADVRDHCNHNAYCPEHAWQLYNSQKNRLTLGLQLSTRLPVARTQIAEVREQALSSLRSRGLFGGSDRRKKVIDLAERLETATRKNCPVCSKIAELMGHYYAVICRLHANEAEFRSLFATRPVCLRHIAPLLRAAVTELNPQAAADFVEAMFGAVDERLVELRDDCEWFTLKFDYRYKDEPWKNARDALPRTITILNGREPGTS